MSIKNPIHPGDFIRTEIVEAAGLTVTAVALVRLLPSFSHLLYGVGQTDPLTLFCASAGLLLVAVAGCFLPASRAMRTDPTRASPTE
jgi:hypothetical protein